MFVVELDHTCFGIFDTREAAEIKQKHLLEVQLDCTIREVVEPDEEPEASKITEETLNGDEKEEHD